MKKLQNIFFALMVLTLVSCSQEKKDTYDESLVPEGYDPNAASNLPATDSALSVQNAVGVADDGQVPSANASNSQQVITTQAIAQPVTKSAKGMNPAHGQPGHDCAIPVGAPLGSAPAASQVTTQTATPAITTTPAASSVITPAGMNPPHGEAGHRCDITVGQPLDSKPGG